MKLPTLSSPLKLFAPAPAGPALGLAGATGGHMMFSSAGNGGRGGGYDDDDYGYDDEYGDEPPTEGPEDEPRRRPRSTRTVRATAAGGATGGQSRVTQHQPEERYWTDYLRIALPVVGLLLMIGLLWYWATQLIGDTPETTDPEPNEIGLVNESTPEPTEEPEQDAAIDPQDTTTIGIGDGASTPAPPAQDTQQPPPPAAGDNQAQQPQQPEPTEEPEPEEPQAAFADSDRVTLTEDGVNVRPEAGLSGDPVTTLNAGTELTIAGGPQDADGYTWWLVIMPDGDSGWVVEDFLQPAE